MVRRQKAIIFGIINAVNTYLITANVYSAEIGSLVATILALISGGAVIATNKAFGRAVRTKING